MELAGTILNKTECLEKLLRRFREEKIQTATTVDNKGMVHNRCNEYHDLRMFASLRLLLLYHGHPTI